MNEVRDYIEILNEREYSLHSEKDIGDFLAETANVTIPHDTPQWRLWIYENYSDTECAIMFKEHHVMADGIGILEIIMMMCDEFKPDAMIDFRPTTWGKQLFLYLISPLFILFYLIPIICKRRDKSCITNVKLSGKKRFAVGRKFPIEDMKRSAKDMKVSLNDLSSAALSLGLAEYLKEKGEKRKGPLTAMIPVNLRTKKATKPSDIHLQNNFILVLLNFFIGESLEYEINRISKAMKKAKRSMKPLATMYIQQLIIRFLPLFITRPLMDYTAGKCTLAFSNVPGFRDHLTLNGRRANNVLFFTPSMSKIGLGISMLSHVDHFKIGVSADTNTLSDPELLLEKIEDNIQRCINMELQSNV